MPSEVDETSAGFDFPPKSTLTSRSLFLFLLDYRKVVDLFFFTVSLAHSVDAAKLTASKALLLVTQNDVERKRFQDNIDNSDRAVTKLNDFAALNSRNLTVNIVDTFLWYISATIQAAMKKRPEMIKSGESIKIEDIFEFSNKRDLIDYLIDRKLNSLSYGGMSKIEKFVRDSMGVAIFPNNDARVLMQNLVEFRNIHVHNRGVVNRVFLSRVSQHDRTRFVEGKRAHLDFQELVELTNVCVQVAIELDTKICKKFGIKRKRYSTWLKGADAVHTS